MLGQRVPVLKISTSMSKASKKANHEVSKESVLYQVPYIYDLAQFDGFFIKALIDSSNKFNAI